MLLPHFLQSLSIDAEHPLDRLVLVPLVRLVHLGYLALLSLLFRLIEFSKTLEIVQLELVKVLMELL